MGRGIDKLKWLIAPKRLKLIYVVRELLLLHFLVDKYSDSKKFNPIEELNLFTYFSEFKKGDEYNYLSNKHYNSTEKIYNSLIKYNETMDKALLIYISVILKELVESIRDKYRVIANKDILKEKIVIDYLNESIIGLNRI